MTLNQRIVSALSAHCYPQREKDALNAVFCAHARSEMKVLDAGCSWTRACTRDAPLEKMHITGIDIDPRVHENPRCNETVVCDLSKRLPFVDNSFDIIYCRWVVEHLDRPGETLCEFARILKPGGHLLVLTPNIFHYATFIARITPFWFHRWWRRAGEGELNPTYYRGNSKRRLGRFCKDAGLQVKQMQLVETPPNYLTRYWPLFLCGVLYERIVNATLRLECMRSRIILEAEKLSERIAQKSI